MDVKGFSYDTRVHWLLQKVALSLQCNEDDLGTVVCGPSRDPIQNWLDGGDGTLFVSKVQSRIEVSIGVPSSSASKAVYFVRRNAGRIEKSNVAKAVWWGDVPPGTSVDVARLMADHLCRDAVASCSSVGGEGPSAVQDFTASLAALESATGCLRPGTIDPDLRNADATSVVWVRQLRRILASKPPVGGCLVAEMGYWRVVHDDLRSLRALLASTTASGMIRGLSEAGRSSATTLRELYPAMEDMGTKCRVMVAYLTPIVDLLGQIRVDGTVQQLTSHFDVALHLVWVMGERCPHADPLTMLLKLVETVCDQAHRHLASALSLDMDIESDYKLEQASTFLHTFRVCFTKARLPKGRGVWRDIPVGSAMAGLDFLQEKIRDVTDLRLVRNLFTRNLGEAVVGGVDGLRTTEVIRQHRSEFLRILVPLRNCLIDNDASAFSETSEAFTEKIDRLESAVGGLLHKAVISAPHLPAMLTALGIFRPFANRPLLRGKWRDAVKCATARFEDELREVWQLFVKHIRSPTKVVSGQPHCPAVLLLASTLRNRVQGSYSTMCALGLDQDISEAYTSLLSDMERKTTETLREWVASAEEGLQPLSCAFLQREGRSYRVSVHPSVLAVLREGSDVLCLQTHLPVPPYLHGVLDVVPRMRSWHQILKDATSLLGAMKTCPPAFQALMKDDIALLSDKLQPGVSSMVWNDLLKHDSFIPEVSMACKQLGVVRDILEYPLHEGEALIKGFAADEAYVPLDPRHPGHTLLADRSEWENAFHSHNAKRMERLCGIAQTVADLIDESFVALNTHRERTGQSEIESTDIQWHDYVDHVTSEVASRVTDMALHLLEGFSTMWKRVVDEHTTIVLCVLSLGDSEPVFSPPITGDGSVEGMVEWIFHGIAQYPTCFPHGEPIATDHPNAAPIMMSIWQHTQAVVAGSARCIEPYQPHLHAWRLTPRELLDEVLSVNYPESQECDLLGAPIPAFLAVLTKCEDGATALRKLPSSATIYSCIAVDARPLRDALAARAGMSYHEVVSHVYERVQTGVHDLETFISHTQDQLSQAQGIEAGPNVLHKALACIRVVRQRDASITSLFKVITDSLAILHTHQALHPSSLQDLEKHCTALPDRWQSLVRRAASIRDGLAPALDRESTKLREKEVLLEKDVARFAVEVQGHLPSSLDLSTDPYAALEAVYEEYEKYESQKGVLEKMRGMLEMPPSPSRVLQAIVDELLGYKAVWDLVCHFRSTVAAAQSTVFELLDFDALACDLDSIRRTVMNVNVKTRNLSACSQLLGELTRWDSLVPVLRSLSEVCVLPRHWSAITGKDFYPAGATLGEVLQLNLPAGERVFAVVDKARDEYDVDCAIQCIAAYWETLRVPTRWGGMHLQTWLLDEPKCNALLHQAADHVSQLYSLQKRKAAGIFTATIKKWLAAIDAVTTSLSTWVKVQREWLVSIGLLPALPDALEDHIIPAEHLSAYKDAMTLYRSLMALCRGGKSYSFDLLAACTGTMLGGRLGFDSLTLCDVLDGPLAASLQRAAPVARAILAEARERFPRFYLLDDQELGLVLLHSTNPPKSLEFFPRVSPGCSGITYPPIERFPPPLHTIISGVSNGEENVLLLEVVECSGGALEYYEALLQAIRSTLRGVITEAYNMLHDTPKIEWCHRYFAQAIATLSRIWFTVEVDAAFDQLEDGCKQAMTELLASIESQNSILTAQARGAAGMLAMFSSIELGRPRSPVEQRRLEKLLVMELHHRDVLQHLIQNKVERAYELPWATHLRMNWGEDGNGTAHFLGTTIPYGYELSPAQDTITVHTPAVVRAQTTMLLALVMRRCGLIQGGPSTGKASIIRDLAGALAVPFFDVACHALSSAVLDRTLKAVEASQGWLLLAHLQNMMPEGLATLAHHVSCKDGVRCGLFATYTTSPTAATLPDSLRSWVRPCSLLLPDFRSMAFATLQAKGFKEPAALAAKIGALYTHAQAMFPDPQWSLAGLCAVLKKAVKRRGAISETCAVVEGVTAVHLATLPHGDVPGFMRLVGALFPEGAMSSTSSDAVIQQSLRDEGLGVGEGGAFAACCGRLRGALAMRKYAVVCGPIGCGKTACWRVAVRASGIPLKEVDHLYPSLLSASEVHGGHSDLSSGKLMVLDCATVSPWLDGVLDTAKSPVVVEALSLSDFTPSLLAKMGVIVLTAFDVGMAALRDRWVSTLDPGIQGLIDFSFDTHLTSMLDWSRKHLPPTVVVTEVMLFNTLTSLMGALLSSDRVARPGVAVVESAAAHAALWTLEGVVGNTLSTPLLQWWRREFPTVDHTANPLKETVRSDLAPEQTTVAQRMKLVLSRGRSTLVVGARGSGRSHLLRWASKGGIPCSVRFTPCTLATTLPARLHDIVLVLDDVHVCETVQFEELRRRCDAVRWSKGLGCFLASAALPFTPPLRSFGDFAVFTLPTDTVHCIPTAMMASAFRTDLAESLPLAVLEVLKKIDITSPLAVVSPASIMMQVAQSTIAFFSGRTPTPERLLRVWQYQCRRVIRDALLSDREVDQFDDALANITVSLMEQADPVGDEHWVPVSEKEEDSDPRLPPTKEATYLCWTPGAPRRNLPNRKLVEVLRSSLPEATGAALSESVARHVSRLALLLFRGKVSLLLGPPGVGKVTLVQLAASLNGITTYVFTPPAASSCLSYFRSRLMSTMMSSCKLARKQCMILRGRYLTESILDVLACVVGGGSINDFLTEEAAVYEKDLVDFLEAQLWSCFHVTLSLSDSESKGETWVRGFPALFHSPQSYFIENWDAATVEEIGRCTLDPIAEPLGDDMLTKICHFVAVTHNACSERCTDQRGGATMRSIIEMFRQIVTIHNSARRQAAEHDSGVKACAQNVQKVLARVESLQRGSAMDAVAVSDQDATTRRYLKQLENQKRTLAEHKESVADLRRLLKKLEGNFSALSCELAKHFEELKPLVDGAYKSLSSLDKNMLSDLKLMSRPPPEVAAVCIAVMVLTSDSRLIKDRSWVMARKTMANSTQWIQSLLNFDCNNIPSGTVDLVQRMIREQRSAFHPPSLMQKSPAASHLCSWLQDILRYHELRNAMRPKEEQHADLAKEIETAKATLLKLEERTKDLHLSVEESSSKYSQCSRESTRLKEIERETAKLLRRAENLLQCLGGGKGKPVEYSQLLPSFTPPQLGDVLLAASIVAYGGFLDDAQRAEWLGEEAALLASLQIGVTQGGAAALVSSKINRAKWEIAGLLPHPSVHEAAGIAVQLLQVPLIYDSHRVCTPWLYDTFRGCVRLQAGTEGLVTKVLMAAAAGSSVVVTHVTSKGLDPAIDTLIHILPTLRFLHSLGSEVPKLDLSDRSVRIHPEFRLFLVTSEERASYTASNFSLCTPIDFGLAGGVMEVDLLQHVMKAISPSHEHQYQAVARELCEATITLHATEHKFLATLQQEAENLLELPDLPAELEGLKEERERAIARSKILAKELESLAFTRNQYLPVVKRGSSLVRCLRALKEINPMYTFSYPAILKVFTAAVATGAAQLADTFDAHSRGVAAAVRASDLSKVGTTAVYRHVAASLEHTDSYVLQGVLCFEVGKGKYPQDGVHFLLTASEANAVGGRSRPPEATWLPAERWAMALTLSEAMPTSFATLPADLMAHARWQLWYHKASLDNEPLPGDWKGLDTFKTLLVVRALRPDQMPSVFRGFVEEELGKEYVDYHPPDLHSTLLSEPLVLVWASPLMDVMVDIMGAYHAVDSKRPGSSVPLLRARGLEGVPELVEQAMAVDGWCVLPNLHLLPPEVFDELSILLSSVERRRYQSSFRLIATASRESAHTIPAQLLGRMSKILLSPQPTIKASLSHAWEAVGHSNLPVESRPLLAAVCTFHAMCIQRNVYNAWARGPHPLGLGELQAAVYSITQRFLSHDVDGPPTVADMQHMVVQCIYFPMVPDAGDGEVVLRLGELVFSPDFLEVNEVAPGVAVPFGAPPSEISAAIAASSLKPSLARISQEVEMAANADLAVQLCRRLNGCLRPSTSPPVDLPPEVHEETITNMARGLPEAYNPSMLQDYIDSAQQATTHAWGREVVHLNSILSRLRRDLAVMGQYASSGGSGETSEDVEGMMAAVAAGSTPSPWLALAGPQQAPLASWLATLRQRDAQLRPTISPHVSLPRVVQLPLLFFPRAFLSAILISVSQTTRVDLEQLTLVTEVSKKTPDQVDSASRDGVHIWGLQLEGARWNPMAQVVDFPTMFCHVNPLPVLTFRAAQEGQDPQQAAFLCSLFRDRSKKEEIGRFTLPTHEPTSTWVLHGVCMLLEA
eukprot:Sspe_Gene.7587::Locus_2577_Transcript_1_1_Confidence_1.000_Length_12906::g.7587::m.7587/K10408/DNAH; dynein heavy chain, axonemal